MDPFLVKIIVCAIAFLCLVVGTKIVVWKYRKRICIRCYQKFRKEGVEKAIGMRGEFYICKECKEIVAALYHKQ